MGLCGIVRFDICSSVCLWSILYFWSCGVLSRTARRRRVLDAMINVPVRIRCHPAFCYWSPCANFSGDIFVSYRAVMYAGIANWRFLRIE